MGTQITNGVGLGQRMGLGGQPQRVGEQMVSQTLMIAHQQVDPPGLDVGQPGLADVAAGDARTVIGQAKRGGQSYIAQADDSDGAAGQGQRRGGDRERHLHTPAQLEVTALVLVPTVNVGDLPSTA